MPEITLPPSSRRIAAVVRGVVQGVGFRPFVFNLAKSLGLGGFVVNETDRVRIELQGDRKAIDSFLETLQKRPPIQAKIHSLEISELPCFDEPSSNFEIRQSEIDLLPGPTIPADLATCGECLAEIFDPSQRRHGYPFTNCTNCGPRWSIIEQLPYDRPRTSMSIFPMCPQCRAEYENTADRRFHAQPIACSDCGPHLRLLDSPASGKVLVHAATGNDDQCIAHAASAIALGKILALQGLGGFQLIADATNAEAVSLLRERKRRPDRPFALMMPSLEEIRRHCEVSEEEAEMLASHRSPIVLLRRKKIRSTAKVATSRPNENPLAANIAPGNPYLGVMLPYTPLHHLLMAAVRRPIVCTSGNLSEEPMAITVEDAFRRLGRIADVFLTHDRPIVRPVDDSIVRFGSTGMQVLRRARGFAPLPIEIRNPRNRTILALGGHLKNTVALCLKTSRDGSPLPSENFSPAIISSHLGDLDSTASIEAFRKSVEDLTSFYRIRPDAVACDLHPDYASTREAERLASQWNVPLVRVQHHHAHVAACMAERDLAGPLLGFAWDGTGYGLDNTIWGGESFLVNASKDACGELLDFTRFSHLRTFPLPGGDAAARQPRRSALGLLYEIFGEDAVNHVDGWFSSSELKTLMQMLRRGTNCPRTSSMGRLFDAVAAMIGLTKSNENITFEGQAAMALEFIAATSFDKKSETAYRIPLASPENGIMLADWKPMVLAILADRAAGRSLPEMSGRFHRALAEMAVAIAQRANLSRIVLSGGCFQNSLLLRLTRGRLTAEGFEVFVPENLPPGDGGISLGQAFIAGFDPLERTAG